MSVLNYGRPATVFLRMVHRPGMFVVLQGVAMGRDAKPPPSYRTMLESLLFRAP